MLDAMVNEASTPLLHCSAVCASNTDDLPFGRLGANRKSTGRSNSPALSRTVDGRASILVVEDEPAVRELAEEVLRAEGFDVLTAEDGQEGLNVAQAHAGPSLMLVVTDIVMPQMDGIVMAEWLRASFPDLRILFTSGYSDEVIAQHGELGSDAQFLPKPYSPLRLIATVREMLGGAYAAADPPIPGRSML